MSGGLVYRYDFVTLKGKGGGHGHGHEHDHDQRGIALRMPGNKRGVRRANGTVLSDVGALRVLDRSTFVPGDTVASLSDVGGQIGVVTGVSRALDLVRFDDDGRRQQESLVSRPRPSEELRRVTGLVLGDYVVSGPWLGRVAEVSLHADVAFDDGALCTLTGAENKLVAAQAQEKDNCMYDLRNGRQSNSVLYSGQRVVGQSPSVFQASRWIKGYWKPSRSRGTVTRVGVAGVLVHWIASMHLGTNKELIQASAPPAWQPNPEKLALFPYPASPSSVWFVGDRCFFRTPPPSHGHDQHAAAHPTSGVVVDDESPSAGHAPHGRLTRSQHGRKWRRRRPDVQRKEWERPMSVAGTRTMVDVLWQDGTRQCGVPSPSLVLFYAARDGYDFFPGQHVIRKPAGEQTPEAAAAPSGVVRSLNFRDKTVCVSWFPAGEGAAMVEEDGGCCETVVSAYDVARHSDANFFYGDVVVRLRHPTTEITANDDLSWVGYIVDLCDDWHINVKWGDGSTSKVLPREIVVVETQIFIQILWEDTEKEQEEGTSAVAAQEPTVAAAIIDNNGAEGDQDSSDGESDIEDIPTMTTRTTMDRVRSAARALIRLAGDVFALGTWNRREAVVKEVEPPSAAMQDQDVVEAAALVSEGDASTSTTCEVKASLNFPRFDVVQSPLDHHFIDNMEQGTHVGRKWTKRVQKEWKILENDLPDTIYVRAFEDRMDLLRVVMVGASGTPYHDGLFFFDMHLPPSYPAEPPLVNYRSFGLRVNPNLYPSGTVCLSLLNTFGGEGGELWSPEASSILQVVVSIQGLVLTAQPYYNEPAVAAHAGTPTGLRSNLPYSENTYLLNLQTMLHLLRRPPPGFEEFVTDHFRRRGQHVIRTCEAYQDGCLVGTLDEEGSPMKDSKKRTCSAGFKLALLNILPRLLEALANIGTQ